jgi:putative membrane protein
MKIILRIIINAVALWVTALVVPGIVLTGNVIDLLIVAVIFGLINALVRPIVKLLMLPITAITLGLFTLAINALMLLLTGWLSAGLTIEGGVITGFLTALLGSIMISIVSTVLSWFLRD